MANERKYLQVTQSFTANGTVLGVVTVASANNFKVKARVFIQSNAQPQREFEVKNIPNHTTIEVGYIGKDIDERADISMYTLLDSARITQPKQKRPSMGPGEIDRAVYAEEPTVARRVFPVDEYGDGYTADNPLPVEATFTSSAGAQNPFVLNAPIPLANIEYPIVLPKECKRFVLRARKASKFFLAFKVGETLTNFITAWPGSIYSEGDLSLAVPLSIYVNSTKALETMEIIYWT